MREKKLAIDRMRGLSILLVLLNHAILYFPIDLHAVGWCKVLDDITGLIALPIFFLIFGYCCHYAEDYWNFVKKKAIRIIVPYFVFSAANLVVRFGLPQFVNGEEKFEDALIRIFLYGGEYWFFYVAFGMSLLIPVMIKIARKSVWVRVFTMIVLTLLIFLPVKPEILGLDRWCYYLLFVYLGCDVQYNPVRWKKLLNYCRTAWGEILLVVNIAIWTIVYLQTTDSLCLVVAKILLVCAALPWLYIRFSYRQSTNIADKFLIDIGNMTLPLYALNGYFLVISRVIIVNICHVENPVIIVLFNLLFDLLAEYCVIKFVMRRFRITRFIMGEK